ncbi:MAG TPA: DMT family transporter [Rudaea sp.]|nr:DMT family transporter [Rudaea sp.]
MSTTNDRTRHGDHASLILTTSFVVLWCTGYPAGKICLDHASPFTLLVFRFGIATALYVAMYFAAVRESWPSWHESRHSLVTGFFSLALQFAGVYLGIALGASAGLAALIIGTMPIVTALFGRFVGEPVGLVQWLGIALGFVGVGLVVGDKLSGNEVHVGAYIALLVGLVGVSAGTLYQKKFGSTIDLRAGLALQHLCATVLLLPFAFYEGFRFDGSPAFYESLGWLIVINSLGGMALLFLLIRRGAATRVAALFFLMPPVTAVMNYFVLGEQFTPLKIAGFAIAAIGVYIGTRKPAHA